MATPGTGTHATLEVAALSGVRPVEVEEPGNDGGSLGTAAALLLEHLARDKLGEVDERTRTAARDGIASMLDEALRRARDSAPVARASLPWAVAFGLAAVLVMGSFGVTFAWVWQLDRRTTEAEAYDRAMAQWLVISNTNSHETMKGIDTMLRGIAGKVGAAEAVDNVPKPVKTEPPPDVAMRALEAQTR